MSTEVDTKAAPAEAAPAEAAPAETAPAEAAPAEAAPAEATPAPVKEEAPVKPEPVKEAPSKTAIQALWSAAQKTGHPEIWGVTLADPESHVPTQIVLQKYLNANDGDIVKATDQLTKTLEWRAKMKPLELLKKEYVKAKFEGLGFVTSYKSEGADAADPESTEVFTWNIYGGVKSIEETFGDLQEFISWRVALMELALADLAISSATKPITADYDPYKIFQVHDYKSLSFFRQSPAVKAASSETIKVFAQNYPELLKEKFFVNVPAIMGFLYTFFKLLVAPKTAKKFHPMANGGNLAKEFGGSKIKGLGEMLPSEYGGKAEDLKSVGKETPLQA